MKFHYVRRFMMVSGIPQDFGIVDIPERDLALTLKQNPDWVDLGEVGQKAEKPAEEKESDAVFECHL